MKENIENEIRKVNWTDELDYGEIDALLYVGVRSPKTLLDMRVFDLLNLFRIDMIRGFNIIYSLYKFYNQDSKEDELIKLGYKPLFNYNKWYSEHRDLSEVTVRDLAKAEMINENALANIYDRVRKAFTDSDEYNWREYRYMHVREIKGNCKGPKNPENADVSSENAYFAESDKDTKMTSPAEKITQTVNESEA